MTDSSSDTQWRSLHSTPSTYGLSASPITTPCYDSTKGSVCSKPDQFLYFDTLHPTTAVMKLMAERINKLVLGL